MGIGAYLARRGYNCAHAEEGGRGAVPLAGELVDRAASYTVPMKAVQSQFGPLGRVRPAPSVAPECAWADRAGSSCARAAACRWCCAVAATEVTAIAVERAGARPEMTPGARLPAAINAPVAAV
jgi:hypothetical protein